MQSALDADTIHPPTWTREEEALCQKAVFVAPLAVSQAHHVHDRQSAKRVLARDLETEVAIVGQVSDLQLQSVPVAEPRAELVDGFDCLGGLGIERRASARGSRQAGARGGSPTGSVLTRRRCWRGSRRCGQRELAGQRLRTP